MISANFTRTCLWVFGVLLLAGCTDTDRQCSEFVSSPDFTNVMSLSQTSNVTEEKICRAANFQAINRAELTIEVLDNCREICDNEFTSFSAMLSTLAFIEEELCEAEAGSEARDIASEIFAQLFDDFVRKAYSLRSCLQSEFASF